MPESLLAILRDPNQIAGEEIRNAVHNLQTYLDIWKRGACWKERGVGTPTLVYIFSWLYMRYRIWPAAHLPLFSLYFLPSFNFMLHRDHSLEVQTDFPPELITLVKQSSPNYVVVPFNTSTLTHDYRADIHHAVILFDKALQHAYIIDAAGPTPFAQGIEEEVKYSFPEYKTSIFPKTNLQLQSIDEGCVAWGFWLTLNFLIKVQTGYNCIDRLPGTKLHTQVDSMVSALSTVLQTCLSALGDLNIPQTKRSFAELMSAKKPPKNPLKMEIAVKVTQTLHQCPPSPELLEWVSCSEKKAE